MTALAAGTVAPDFTLHSTPDQEVSLHEFRGRPGHARLLSGGLEPRVRRPDGALQRDAAASSRATARRSLGISVDGVWCHAAFAKDRKLHFPLLADFEPKGAVARQYGVYRERDGCSERALFVIDAEGRIRWSYVSPIGVNPGADGILDALETAPGKAGAMSKLAAARRTGRPRARQRRARPSRWWSTATTSARTAAPRTRS